MPEISVAESMSIGALAFMAWAWVVYWGIGVMRKELREMGATAAATAQALTDHILLTEKRLTMLETEFAFLRRYISHGHEEN